jgi:inner membrane protein YidH
MQHPEVRANDTLANERTFLAYVRTALAFVAFGYVIARFSLFSQEIAVVAHIVVPREATTVFGITMATMGILVGLFGAYRYIATDRGLHRGDVVAMPSWVAIVNGLVIAGIGVFVAFELLALR